MVCFAAERESERSQRIFLLPAMTTVTANASDYSPNITLPVRAGINSHTPAVTYLPMADGAAGTFQALSAMAACVRGEVSPDFSGHQDEFNRRAAESIVSGVHGTDTRGEIAALFFFVRDCLVYRNHPWNQQRVQDCRRTLEIGSGDCVSKSVCLSTMLAALGHPSRFVAQSSDGCEYSHVYVEAWDGGAWVALDSIVEQATPGWSQQLPDGGFETTWPIFE